jgi:hypothetical protein
MLGSDGPNERQLDARIGNDIKAHASDHCSVRRALAEARVGVGFDARVHEGVRRRDRPVNRPGALVHLAHGTRGTRKHPSVLEGERLVCTQSVEEKIAEPSLRRRESRRGEQHFH